MGQRAKRGRDQYFDADLVDLVDGLLNSATVAEDGRQLVFPLHDIGKRNLAAVHNLFNIDPQELTTWRFGDWKKRAVMWPLEFVDRLIFTFAGGDYETLSELEDARKARLVHKHWEAHCADDLKDVRERLEKHRLFVAQLVARPPSRSEERQTATVSVYAPDPVEAAEPALVSAPFLPADLSPPPCPDCVPRPAELDKVSVLGNSHLGVVIEGRPKSGKRQVAYQYISTLSDSTRVLWFNLIPQSELKEVLAGLASVERPFTAALDRAISSLADWLKGTNTALVLAGLNEANGSTFAPLLQLLSRLPGPCRVIVTSAVRTGGSNACEIGRLTGSEAVAILELAGATFDPDEIRALVRESDLSPFALRQAAARFGSISRAQLAADMDVLHIGIVASLPTDLRSVFEVLQVLNTDINVALVSEVLRAFEIADAAIDVLTDLERLLLVRRVTARSWRLEPTGTEPAPLHISDERLEAVFVRLAAFYRAKVERRGVMPKPLSHEDCLNLFAACRLLQLAEQDPRQRHWLSNRFAARLERFGGYRQMLTLYAREMEFGEPQDPWLCFRYARVLFVVGRYDQALGVLDKLFHALAAGTRGQSDDLYLSVVRLVAEILIEVGQSKLATRILDAVLENAEVGELSQLACTSTVSVLSWSLAKSGMPEACIALNEDILDKNFAGLAHPFSRYVSDIRVGVAMRELGRLPESIAALDRARTYFATADARAFAWSAANLAVSLRAAGDIAGAAHALGSAMDVNASHNFANGEALATYRLFAGDPEYEALRPALSAELERLAALERGWLEIGSRITDTRFIGHVLLDLDVSLSEPFVFEKTKYELLSFESPHAIASRFNQSLVRRLREADLETTLEDIFKTTAAPMIFRNHLYNRIIVDACRDNVILTKKFIRPHLDVIKGQSDSILFFYARHLESAKEIEHAEALLERVRRKEGFSYYNIRANCASHTDPLVALHLNDEALRLAHRRQREAQILNNKARIVYDHNMRYRFAEAMTWCEEANRRAIKPNFHWPRNLLLKFALAQCRPAEVEAAILAHRARFGIPGRSVVKIVSELKPGRLREAALRVAQALD